MYSYMDQITSAVQVIHTCAITEGAGPMHVKRAHMYDCVSACVHVYTWYYVLCQLCVYVGVSLLWFGKWPTAALDVEGE